MDIKQAYDIWADEYDNNKNKTRDLEAIALRSTLNNIQFDNCLEIGCGTGKNTVWLMEKSKKVTALDFSEEMLLKAKGKINAGNVQFINVDITNDWIFINEKYDLVTFSLVLEHIEDLDKIFKKVSDVTTANGFVYVGELHPFKQYSGTKARFDTKDGQQIVNCFSHNISDFTIAAKNNNFEIVEIKEHFDDNDRTNVPRILMLLLKKNLINNC